MTTAMAFDPGFGNIKIYGPNGGLVMQSCVAVRRGDSTGRMTGLRTTRKPLCVETDVGAFYVGEGAHDWGQPVESLDFSRLTGAPEMIALFLGSMSRYGLAQDPVDLIVGLPIETLAGEEAKATQQAVRGFLRGEHAWCTDGQAHTVTIERVQVTSQPVGAMFDYLLTDDGEMPTSRRAAFRAEIGILGIGMNTVELLAVRNGAAVQRFTAGETLGVRRLLELVNPQDLYSLAELDAQLRAGNINTSSAIPIWQGEVIGFLERAWGKSARRFRTVVLVGGGALLLREALLRRFKDKAYIPNDPVMATARGLYKYALMRARKRR